MCVQPGNLGFTVINSTYQSADASGGNEEDVLYQSDASFSAKLDNSQSHNTNKQTIQNAVADAANAIANTNDIINYNNNNSNENNNLNDIDNLSSNKATVSNGNANSPSSTNVYKTNSNSKLSSRYNNKNYSVKSAANSSKQTNSNVNSAIKSNGQSAAANQNTVHIDDYKQQPAQQRVDFYDKTSGWSASDDDIYSERQTDSTNDDYVYGIDDVDSGKLMFSVELVQAYSPLVFKIAFATRQLFDAAVLPTHRSPNLLSAHSGDDSQDYNGNKNTASESIVIKIDSNDKITAKSSLVETTKNGDKFYDDTVTEWSISDTKTQSTQPSSTPSHPPATASASLSTSTAPVPVAPGNDNFNNEYYYSKDDMSVYDDVNNNRLNLHNNNAQRGSAFEQRNIYVTNNGLSDAGAGGAKINDTPKSYIHIEVYKGHLYGVSTKRPKSAAQRNETQPAGGNGRLATDSAAHQTNASAKVPTAKP